MDSDMVRDRCPTPATTTTTITTIITSHHAETLTPPFVVTNNAVSGPPPPMHLNRALELVADVQLVGVKQQQNHVRPLREVLHNVYEVIGSAQPLLLTRQHSRGVDQGDAWPWCAHERGRACAHADNVSHAGHGDAGHGSRFTPLYPLAVP
jgi:hypothetical protein